MLDIKNTTLLVVQLLLVGCFSGGLVSRAYKSSGVVDNRYTVSFISIGESDMITSVNICSESIDVPILINDRAINDCKFALVSRSNGKILIDIDAGSNPFKIDINGKSFSIPCDKKIITSGGYDKMYEVRHGF